MSRYTGNNTLGPPEQEQALYATKGWVAIKQHIIPATNAVIVDKRYPNGGKPGAHDIRQHDLVFTNDMLSKSSLYWFGSFSGYEYGDCTTGEELVARDGIRCTGSSRTTYIVPTNTKINSGNVGLAVTVFGHVPVRPDVIERIVPGDPVNFILPNPASCITPDMISPSDPINPQKVQVKFCRGRNRRSIFMENMIMAVTPSANGGISDIPTFDYFNEDKMKKIGAHQQAAMATRTFLTLYALRIMEVYIKRGLLSLNKPGGAITGGTSDDEESDDDVITKPKTLGGAGRFKIPPDDIFGSSKRGEPIPKPITLMRKRKAGDMTTSSLKGRAAKMARTTTTRTDLGGDVDSPYESIRPPNGFTRDMLDLANVLGLSNSTSPTALQTDLMQILLGVSNTGFKNTNVIYAPLLGEAETKAVKTYRMVANSLPGTYKKIKEYEANIVASTRIGVATNFAYPPEIGQTNNPLQVLLDPFSNTK